MCSIHKNLLGSSQICPPPPAPRAPLTLTPLCSECSGIAEESFIIHHHPSNHTSQQTIAT